MTHDFKSFLNGIESTNLKQEIFLGILRQSGIGVLLYFVISILVKPHMAALLVAVAFMLFILSLYFLGGIYARKESFNRSYTLFCLGYGCLFLPLMYIYGGGIQSGVPILYILSGFVTVLLLDNLIMYMVLTGTFSLLVILFYAEYTHPALIHIESPDFMYLYIPFCTVFAGVSVGLILNNLLRNSKENRKMSTELFRQLKESAIKDSLSGVYNRRYFMNLLDSITKKAEEDKSITFSLIMIDLDHFKQINDRYGHLTGDKCIKKTASVAANIIGDNNIIGRYGGEEFICILKDTNESDAFEMAEKIRLAVKEETGKLPIVNPVTISCGISSYSPGKTTTDLINESDHNLYIAKGNGRDRVVWRNGATPPTVNNKKE